MKKADNFDAKQWLVENKITTQSRLNEEETEDTNTKNNIIVGYRWKSNQMRIDNLEEALAIIGYGKNQSSLKNQYPIEGKRVAFYNLSTPNSASEKLRKAGKLEEWFEPVYK